MINTEPELIAWLRQQIERDIRVMKQALTWPPRKPGLQDLLQSVLEWRRGKETSALRAETEERLPNRRMLLRILDEHPHDRHLGCRTCHAANVVLYPIRVCTTVRLLAALYRKRDGYRPEWQSDVDQLMAGHFYA
jgi:hypothetical protein